MFTMTFSVFRASFSSINASIFPLVQVSQRIDDLRRNATQEQLSESIKPPATSRVDSSLVQHLYLVGGRVSPCDEYDSVPDEVALQVDANRVEDERAQDVHDLDDRTARPQFFLNGVDRVDFHLSLKVEFMFLVLIGNFLLLFELFLMLIV